MKQELRRLKALSLSACNKKELEKNAVVFFIQGKALIYIGEEEVTLIEDYSGIGGTSVKNNETTCFSTGVEAVRVQSKEDAIELATAILEMKI